MENSRTKNTVLNSLFGILSFVSIILVSFLLRKILAATLGKEYLGLNSLYTTIVSMLSLTELGISNAIIYFLYKPVTTGDEEKIKQYLAFYKKAYYVIALIVAVLGAALIFVIPFVAKTNVEMRKVQAYFILYVFNTAVSYLIAYKKCIIYADQRSRVISVCHAITKIIFSIAQILVLYFTSSFLAFILIMIFCTVADNLSCAVYANAKYPYIKQKPKGKLSDCELSEIKAKMLPIAVQSLAGYVVSSTDSIIISSVISVGLVGIYSNYTLISTTLKSLYGQVFASFTNSFGNLSVSGDTERAYGVYCNSVYFAFIMTCCMSACFFSLVNPFIKLCFGADYVLSVYTTVLVVSSFYFTCMNVPSVSVQNALGLHNKDATVMIVQAVLNLVLSIALVFVMGLNGVVVGTVVSTLLCPFISKDYVLHKYYFNRSPFKVYFNQTVYFILTVIASAACYLVCTYLIVPDTWLLLIADGVICLVASILVAVGFTFKTANFKYAVFLVKSVFKR